jgi:hypothetical protein
MLYFEERYLLSKFQSKYDEGFLLGHSSNSKIYRVYNKSKGFVEEAYDVQFDETMGSQDEKENLDDVRGKELSKAMKTMAIEDIMLREEDYDEGPLISIQAHPSTSTTNYKDQQEGNSSNNDSSQEDDQMASMTTTSMERTTRCGRGGWQCSSAKRVRSFGMSQ